jgi:hypothetical protein
MNTSATDLPPPVNHVFVDFENVHEVDLEVVGRKSVHVTLLLGPRQTRLDVALVEKLLEHASTVQLVRLTSDGRNALDFALAYYVGRASPIFSQSAQLLLAVSSLGGRNGAL